LSTISFLLIYKYIILKNIFLQIFMKNNLKAFTLVELIVAITIMVLIVLWINNISLNKISEAQKVWIFYNKLKSNIESTINYSLIWKSIDSSLNVPKFWEININSNSLWAWLWTWQIIVSYWNASFQTYTWFSVKSPNFYSITNIKCVDLQNNKSNDNDINLLIENWNIQITNCPNPDEKIIEFDVMYKKYTKHISINSINNVIN
jgi:prepilin-type N-terminal cleavage/methylation domain-containing protein